LFLEQPANRKPLIDLLDATQNVKVIAAVRTQLNADFFEAKGISNPLIDLDIYEAGGLSDLVNQMERGRWRFPPDRLSCKHARPQQGCYDASKAVGVGHIVHLGAYATADTTIVHLVGIS